MKSLQAPEQIASPTVGNAKHRLASLSSLIGLSAGALGWSSLASANDEGRDLQTLILPDTYSALDDGTVILQLETGEQLTLTADQYVILDGGLLLVVDELAQNSVAELPVLGSLRTQLFTEVQPVRSPDGTIVEATNQQPLWSGEGPAPRLFEEIDIQRFEIAQDQQEEDGDGEGLFLGGAGGALVGIGITTLGIMNTGDADDDGDESTDGGGSGGGDPSAIGFVSGTTAKVFEQSTGTVYTAQATSTNAGSISYAIIGGADQGKFSINPSTGVLTFDAAPSYSSPTDNGGDNVYDIQIEATDSAGEIATRSLAVQVLEVAQALDLNGGSMAELSTAFGKLYYAYTYNGDEELWEYDPNNGNAQLVENINTVGPSSPESLIEYQGDGGALYFKANDGSNVVVHKYDGTSVSPIPSLTKATYTNFLFRQPIEWNGKLYFINAIGSNLNSELTEWDGSSLRVIAGKPGWTASPVGPFGSADGQTLYTGAIDYNSDKGTELYYWEFGSTLQDLTHATSFNVTSNDVTETHSYPQFMIEYDGSLFTRAASHLDGKGTDADSELWEFDPTDNSKAEYEIGSGTHSGLIYAPMIVFKDKLYMLGDDNDANTGNELFVFDRSGIPELVMDINQGPGDGLKQGNNEWYPTIFNDKLYFVANDGSGSDIWVYDGLTDPTKAFDFQTSSTTHLTSLTVLDDTLYFLGDSGGATATTGDIDLWSVS